MATSKAKSAGSSWTIWFGILSIVLGGAISILALLGQQDIIDLNTGVWATVSGILTIALRIKTRVAIALKVDDPTTPEDESKGEIAMTGKGFATLVTMAALTVLAAAMLVLTGCGTVFTAGAGDIVNLDMKPSKPAYVAAFIGGVETCKINVPEGTIRIKNVCIPPQVSTMTPENEPTCLPNPCANGTLVFDDNGFTACK